jgi:hypothetical protein
VPNHISTSTFDRVVAALVWIAFYAKSGIKKIKTAIEARRHVGFRIQNERPNECRSMITAFPQEFGDIGQQRRQRMAEIRYRMKLGIGTGEYCGAGNRRQRRLRVRLLEHYPLARECIQIRREPISVAQEAHAVRAGGVYSNYDDVRRLGPRSEAGGQDCDKNEEPGTAQKNKEEFTKVNSSSVFAAQLRRKT